MKKRIIRALLLAALLAPGVSHATTILFDDFRTGPAGSYEYVGEFNANASGAMTFSAAFGDCADCLYDNPIGIGSFPNGHGIFHEIVMAHSGRGQLNYYPKAREFDTFVGISGRYCVVGFDAGCTTRTVPEVPAVFLVAIGLFLAAAAGRKTL